MSMRKLRALRHGLVAAVLTGALLPAVSTGVAAAAPSIPPGFVLQDTPTGVTQLTDFGYLPDGSIIAVGKQGAVRWVSKDGTTAKDVASLAVKTDQDLGLIGLAIAPDYATSHQIYLNRVIDNGSGFTMRMSRFTIVLDGDGLPSGLTGEQTLFEVPGTSIVHSIDTVVAASDGTLWLSIGDSSDYTKTDPAALRAQDLDAPYGKIFHLDANGNGVPSNPYYDPANPGSTRSKVFARGFRNPFRFGLDPTLGLPVVGDVGYDNYEELDVVQRGGNYGWPCWEASHPSPGYSDLPGCNGVPNTVPLVEYPHGGGLNQGNSVVGGIAYTGNSYPDSYRGAFFFGDYVSQQLWTVHYDDKGQLVSGPETPSVFTGMGGPVKFGAAPNGDIVYADIYSGNLRRLTYSPGNHAPIASATTSTDPATRTVTFDASGSIDYDNDPMKYYWDFGDGTTASDTGTKVSHQYAPGTDKFTATLTVKDQWQAAGTATITVAPSNHTPQITLTTPGDAATFAVAQQVNLSATATDAEDGALPITWSSTVRHCPTLATCHSHPGVGGSGASFGVPFTNHPDSHMEITASVTDSAGVTATATYVAQPRQHRLTLTSTQPAKVTIPVEGDVNTAMVTEGATFDIDAQPLASDGVSTFTGWQGGPTTTSWTITVGSTDQTITANYATPIDQRYNGDSALQAQLGAPAGPEITDGPVHYRAYANGRLYWTAATGVHVVTGPILDKYLSYGGHTVLGAPTVDTSATPDGVGQYTHFQNWASIYYSPDTGAHEIGGRIRDKYASLGWEQGPLGYPSTDELGTPDGVGRFNHFLKNGWEASVYWTPSTDAHAIYGLIRQHWAELGWERGIGYPTDDEDGTPDGVGRFNHFTGNASIYFTASTGVHDVLGEIRNKWASMGWERSWLGYPTSNEYGIPGGRRSDFQGGYITWTPAGGAVPHSW